MKETIIVMAILLTMFALIFGFAWWALLRPIGG